MHYFFLQNLPNLNLTSSCVCWSLAIPALILRLMGLLWADTMFYGQQNIEWKPKNVTTMKSVLMLYNDTFFSHSALLEDGTRLDEETSSDGSKVSWALLWRFVWSSSKYVTKLPHTSHSFTSIYTFTLNLALHRLFVMNPKILTKEELYYWLTLMLVVTPLSDLQLFDFNNVKLVWREFWPQSKVSIHGFN